MALDASDTSDLDTRRTCECCKTRMSSLLHDRHSICIGYHGLLVCLRSIVLSVNLGLMNV